MIPLSEQIEAVEREIRLREAHYPRWVEQKKLIQKTADLELARMKAVRDTLISRVCGWSYEKGTKCRNCATKLTAKNSDAQ